MIHKINHKAMTKGKEALTIRGISKTNRKVCLRMMLISSHHLMANQGQAVEMQVDQKTPMELSLSYKT